MGGRFFGLSLPGAGNSKQCAVPLALERRVAEQAAGVGDEFLRKFALLVRVEEPDGAGLADREGRDRRPAQFAACRSRSVTSDRSTSSAAGPTSSLRRAAPVRRGRRIAVHATGRFVAAEPTATSARPLFSIAQLAERPDGFLAGRRAGLRRSSATPRPRSTRSVAPAAAISCSPVAAVFASLSKRVDGRGEFLAALQPLPLGREEQRRGSRSRGPSPRARRRPSARRASSARRRGRR